MKIYVVGGAVRDRILGLLPNDIDYCVVGSNHDEMIASGFECVGAAFPVYLGVDNCEYALARTERSTGDSYRDFACNTNNVTIEDDLARRDFTMNSIAMDCDTGEFIDPFDGIADLLNGTIRHTSSAFVEDPLRVIRMARFAAKKIADPAGNGFVQLKIAPETFELAKQMIEDGMLDTLSPERFVAEFVKVTADNYDQRIFWHTLTKLGAFQKVKFLQEMFKEWNPYYVRFVRESADIDQLQQFRYAVDTFQIVNLCIGYMQSNEGYQSFSGAATRLIADQSSYYRRRTLMAAAVKNDTVVFRDYLMSSKHGFRFWTDEGLVMLKEDMAIVDVALANFDRHTGKLTIWYQWAKDAHDAAKAGQTRITSSGMEPGPQMGEAIKAMRVETLANYVY